MMLLRERKYSGFLILYATTAVISYIMPAARRKTMNPCGLINMMSLLKSSKQRRVALTAVSAGG